MTQETALGTVLVTGAGKRLGRSLALALAQDGWDVVAHYNASSGGAEAVAAEIRAMGRRSEAVGADLGDASAVDRLVPAAVDALGPLTALVNNASIFEPDTAGDMNRAGFGRHMAINLEAPLFLAKAFYAQLPADRRGAIVNLLDHKVLRLTAGYFTYTVSKAALWDATRLLAMALRPRVRVNGVGPGLTLPSGGQTDAEFEAMHVRTPLKVGPTDADIVDAVRYLLTAPTVTGQMLAVDAGAHLMAYKDAEGPEATLGGLG